MKLFYYCLGFALLFLMACGQENSKPPALNSAPEASQKPLSKPKLFPELENRIVFFELKNQSGDGGFVSINRKVRDDLHNQFGWLQIEGHGLLSADSSLKMVVEMYPAFDLPYVHKFFSVDRVKELRFGEVVKVRMTWQKRKKDGRPQAGFSLYRNESHGWRKYANPGSFSFPSDEAFAESKYQLKQEEIVNAVVALIVRLSYKLTA